MKKLHRGRLLLSTCLTGIALVSASGAQAQDKDPTWQPRAEVDARAADGSSQVSFELFAPVAQNDSSLMFVSGRIGTDERYDRNGSVTVGGRGKIGEDVAIGVNAGVDFYKSNLSKRDVTAASFGLEGFTSVFDVRLNYRLPVTNRSTIGYLDPNASPVGVLSVENNRLIERKSGWRLEDVPLGGANAEIGATAPLSKKVSLRASVAGFDYRDDAASKGYRGARGGLELGVEDPLGSGGRFSLGAELQNDNRWGTQARGTVRLAIPLGRGSRDRSAGTSGLDRQMGDRIRRDYVSPSGTRYTDLTSTSFAIDARTGNEFGGVFYVNGAAAAAGAGTSTSPTTLGDAATRAGQNGIVVALGNAGTIASGGVTLATNQYLVGGASSVSVRHSDGSVSAYSFGGANGIIVGNNAGGAAVTLGQGSVVRDVTVRGSGSGILANGVGGFALERVAIENTGAAGLTLTNTTGAVVIDGITIRGGAGAGLVVNGGSNVTLRNSTIGGGAGAIDINDAGGNLTTSLSNLTLSATGGTVLDIDGSGAGTVAVAGLSGIAIAGGNGETGGFAARNVTFDSSTAAGIQAVNAGTMQVGTAAARVNGAGVSLTEVDGALTFGTLNVFNNAGTGLTVNNTKTGTFTLANATGAVDTTAGTALNLDPLLIDLNFTAVSSVGATGAGIVLSNVQGAGAGGNALTIGTLTITNSGQQGLYINGGSTGLVTIGGGTIANSGGASVQVGQSGVAGSGGTIGLNFGAAISDAGAGPLVSIFNIGGAIRFTGTISGAGPITLGDTLAGSSVTFAGATTITGSASPAISLDNLAGSTAFSGTLTIANPAGTGILIGTVPGGVTFGDVDITGLGAGTGVDLTNASGNITFGTLDITGTGAAGSTGIDLTGATNAGAVTITKSSLIQGVDIGVNLTNANITGTFRFGDGNGGNGLGSRITADTVIVVAGMNAAQGTYDFGDVQLDGDTNNITGGSFTAYYVLAGANGTGTATDPGSIAGAAASGAQYIVLLNDPTGGQDVIDTAGLATGSLLLNAGQSLVSFLNTDFFAVTGATVPANLIVSNLGPTGIVNTYAGSGAAILTSSIGGTMVTLANDTRIDGVVIHDDATGTGILGAGVSNAIIRNSDISGSSGAIRIIGSGGAASVTLSNLNLSSSGGTTLNIDGSGAGTVNVSGAGINITATGAAQGLVVNDATVGTLDIASVTTGNAAGLAAVQVTQVSGGAVNIGNVTVGGATTGVGLGIANNSATVSVGAVTTADTHGIGVVVSGNTGDVTLGAVTVTNGGAEGVRVSNNSGAVALGTITATNTVGAGLRVSSAAGDVTVAGAAIIDAGEGIEVSNVSGSLTIGATSIADSTGTGIVFGAGNTGTIRFGDTDITGLGANQTGVDARSSGGTVTFATLDISGNSTTGTRGIDLTGATFAGSFTVTDSSTITGVGTGVDLTNAAITGSFRFGDGSNTDADGAHSIINAVTPIAIGGLNQTVGGYNFSDVNLIGDITSLATNPVTLFFVEQGRTGAGTATDPGSLAAAMAANAQYIVLLNNPAGGNDTLDVSGLGTLTLDANQHLIGFLNGDTQNVGGGTPANLFLYGITPGIVTNPYAGSGAALLTNSGAGATVTLASGSAIDGLRIGGAGIGVSGTGVSGVSITNSVISGALGAIDLRDGGANSSATLTNLALSATGGTVFNALGGGGGTLTLTGSGLNVTATGTASALAIDTVALGGDLRFGTVSTQVAGWTGVSLSNLSGSGTLGFTSIGIAGTTVGDGLYLGGSSAAVDLGNVTVANTSTNGVSLIGNGGAITMGAVTVTNAGGNGVVIDSNTGDVTLGSFAISGGAAAGLDVSGQSGSFTAGPGTVTNPGGVGILLLANNGDLRFTGAVTVTNPGTAGILLGGNNAGTIRFADTTIGGLTANTTGLDAGGGTNTAAISFATLDITGTSTTGTRGIDLSGSHMSGSLIVSGSSTITGVGTGVDLTNANITGNFRFGDGSNTDANGAGSTISAITPLIVAGMNAVNGTYDFADVNMVGDTSNLSTSATIYWVLAGASGAGTRGDPGSLAGAAASGADIIILVNNPAGGNDAINANDPTYGTGGTFTLLTNQQLRGFLNGDTIALPGGAPANVVLYNIAQGIVTNPFAGSGAPTLTTSAGGGANTVVVSSGSSIDGVIIANGGTGAGVYGSGAGNVTIRNSNISGANGAINFSDGGAAASVALSNLNLWASNNTAALTVRTIGAGSTTISQLSNIVVEGGHGENGGANFSGAVFDSDTASAGYTAVDASLQIGSTTTRVNGTGTDLAGASGALNFTGLSIYNANGYGLNVSGPMLDLSSTAGTIDTIDGRALSLENARTDLVLDRVVHTGFANGVDINGLTGIGAGGRALQVADLQATSVNASGIMMAGDVTGGISFGAASSISATSGNSVVVSSGTGTLDFRYDGSVVQSNNAVMVGVQNFNGSITFGATSNLSSTNGTGLIFLNADGTVRFDGTTSLNGSATAISILSGSGGNFFFGAGTSINSSSGAVSISGNTASVTYEGSITQRANAGLVTVTNHSAGTISFQDATLSATNGTGLSFSNADGTYNFGALTLSGGARIGMINGSAGTFTFGDIDITGLGANTTAVNLTGATGNVTFATLDITGNSTAGTRGIDLTGNSSAGNITVNGSSQISGVGIGVDLTNAAMTGNFRYGDGSNSDANGAASSITAVTPLVIAGLNGGSGNYNFADVTLNGDTSNLSVSAYFVLEGATGSGTRSDPGSLAGAEASGAAYIVLLNDPNGGNDTLDATADAGGSLDLAGGQSLFSFRNTDSFIVSGGAPANVLLFNVQAGLISNPFTGSGAPTLTASGTNATVTLGGSNILDGLIITNSGSGAGVLGNGVGGTSILRNSTISGGAAGAVRIYDNAANVVLGLSNLQLSATGNNILNLDGSGTGSFTVTQFNNLSATHGAETGGFILSDLSFDSDTVAAGLQAVSAGTATLGSTVSRITGTGLSLTNVFGTLNFADLNIANDAGTGLIVANSKANNFTLGTTGGAIDTTNGTAINLDPLTVHMALGSVNSTGGAYGVLLDQVEGDFSVSGTVNVNGATTTGIAILDNTAQTDALDTHFLGQVTIVNTTGGGVSLTNNAGATVDFTGGLDVTTTTGTGFLANDGGTVSVTGAGNTITTGDGAALSLTGGTIAAAGLTFGQITAAPTTTAAITATGVTLTGALNIGGLDIDGIYGGVALSNLSGAGGVNFTGTLDLDTTGIGLDLSGALGTVNIANTAGSALTIDGALFAIRDGVTSGTVNIASTGGTASIGASTGSAILLVGGAGTLNYGGTINVTAGNVLNVLADAGTLSLTGAITSTTTNTAFNLGNADGTYTISGTVTQSGGAGVAVAAASSGAITFSGANDSFSSGTATAVSMAGAGTLAFTGGGLGLTTTSGTGFLGLGSGAIQVSGSGNTITTAAGIGLGLTNLTVVAGGVTFDQITAAPAGAAAVSVSGVTLTGALNIGGLRDNGGTTGFLLNNISGTGGVNLTGTIDLDSVIGLSFQGAVGTVNVANTAGSVLTIDNSATGISFSGVTSGTVNIGTGAGTASIGATNAAIFASGGTGGTLAYGGTINSGSGAVLFVNSSSADITLTGAITSAATGDAFTFAGADGTYVISGSVSHAGASGVSVDAASAGNITFSNASKAFSTGTYTAVSMAGTGSLSFTGGGLDIDTTSGIGLTATGGTLVVTGANNKIDTATGQVLNLSGVTAGTNGINFTSLTATGTVAATAINLTNLDGDNFSGGTVNIAGTSGAGHDGVFIGGGSAAAIGFGATTIAATADNAIEVNGTNGAVTFGTVTLTGGAGDVVLVTGATSPVSINTGTISAGAGTYAVNIAGGTGEIGIAADLSGANAVLIDNHETGIVTFSGNMSANVTGISITNVNSGTINFIGKSMALPSISLGANAGGTINFNPTAGGNGLDITSLGLTGFSAVSGGTVTVTGSGNSINSGAFNALELNGVTVGANGINFASIQSSGAANGVLLNNVGTLGGAIILGTVNLQGMTARGIDISGTFAPILTINDLDIGLNSNAGVAFDLNGATLGASINIGDFDVTNAGTAGTSIGVDLRGTLGGAAIQLGGNVASGATSTIVNVGTGIYLNAATNASLTYGDREAGNDTGSTISATTAINATNAPTLGTYDFRDVAFSGSPGTGFGLNHVYFVDADGATGGGNGSGSDGGNPMTLAAAELSAVAEDVIILVNNGNVISAAGTNGNDSLVLASNVQVRGFGNGTGGGAGSGSAPIVIALTVPSTILLSGGGSVSIADPGNGAATLTSVAGSNVITLGASGNHLSGFILDGLSTANRGIKDNGAGATNTLIDHMTIRNFVTGGIEITPSTNTTVDNVSFSNNPSDLFFNSAASSVITNVTSNGATGTAMTLIGTTGTTTLTNVNIGSASAGILFNAPGGTVNATNVDIGVTNGAALSIAGGTASLTFDTNSSITQSGAGAAVSVSGGHATGTLAYAGTIIASNGTGLQFDNADGIYNFTGTTTLNGGDAGIDIIDGSGGTFSFGANTSIASPSGTAFNVSSSNAAITYSGSITQANNMALVSVFNHSGGTITFDTGTLGATNGTGLQFTNASGSYNFTGTTTLNGGDAGIDITSGSSGTFGFGTGTTLTHGGGGDAFVMTDSNANLTYSGSISDSIGNVVRIYNHDAGTVTFNTGTISGVGANALGISVTNSNGGAIRFNGQTTLSTQANTAVTLGSNAGSTIAFGPDASIGNALNITTTSGTAVAISGGGTVNVTGFANTITTGSGTLLDISNSSAVATALNLTFASGSNTLGANGILVSRTAGTLTGSVSIGAGSITATTRGVDIDGGSLVFDYAGSIATSGTAGRSVEVTNMTAGVASFSGNLTDTAQGINIANNSGGQVNFYGQSIAISPTPNATGVAIANNSGTSVTFSSATGGTGLDIVATGTGAGLSAINTGFLTVYNPASANTISTQSGTALTISNTAIGSFGVTFQSISSNGAANGIVLNNTGTSNGLTVTGTGTASSGGTIQNSTGDGISLTGTANVRLAYMDVKNNLGDGIGGSNVNGFVIDHFLIETNGDDAGTDESGINIINLSGSDSTGTRPTGIFNSTIQNNNEFEVQISNSSGTLKNFQVVNSNFSSNGVAIHGNATSPHGNLFNFLGTGSSAMGISVSGSHFTGNTNSGTGTVTGSGLFADTSGTSMVVQVSGSTFTNNNNGINVSTGPGASTLLTYIIDGNTITGSIGNAINDFQNGNVTNGVTRTVSGTITNNIIGTSGASNSGSQTGAGIAISNEGAVSATYLISGNTIQEVGQFGVSGSAGISVDVGLFGLATEGGTTNATITNNTIANIRNGVAISVSNNESVAPLPKIWATISGNQLQGAFGGQAGNGDMLWIASVNGGVVWLTQTAAGGGTGTAIDIANGTVPSSKVDTSGTITYGQMLPPTPAATIPLP